MISYHFKGIIQHMTQKYNATHLIVGRFNPLTKYHAEIIVNQPGIVIGMTTSHNSDKNPLEPNLKYRMLEYAFAKQKQQPVVIMVQDVLQAVIYVGKGFCTPEIILHCGSDRATDYLRLNTYTEPEGIRIVDVVSTDRLAPEHSATYLRELARDGKKKEFKALCGFRGNHRDVAYRAIRTHYGCI